MGTPARYYSSTAVSTTLSASLGAPDTSLTVASNAGFPSSYPFTLILEKDSANEEIVTVTGLSGSSYLITRGVDGTVARAHAAGTSVEHGVSALDFTDFRSHQAAAADVHEIGATSQVVGTNTTQTLTNKTLTSPTINGGTVNATTLQQGGVPAVTTTGTQTLTNKTLSAPTINNGVLTGTSLAAPTVGDFSNAQHDHSTAAKGGNIPQSSVTGLPAALDSKESVANVAAHTSATVAHGATGAVVGTTNTQTLTNKTLTSPTITSPTVSGSVTATGATVTGGTLSGQTITGASLGSALDAATNKVTNVGTPTASTDAATKGYVDSTTVASAGDSMTGNLAMGGNKVTGLATPTISSDAATKGYVDTSVANVIDAAPGALDTLNELAAALGDDANFSTTVTNSIATKVAKAGDGMTGDLTFSGGATAKGVPNPTSGSDASNKTYTDTKVAKAGDTMTGDLAFSGGAKITGIPTPTAASDATPKSYIDQLFGDTASAEQSDQSAAQSAIAAAQSAGEAAESAGDALASEQAAAQSAANAAASEAASAISAGQASTSASEAATSASQAAASQSAASASEIAADASKVAAASSQSAAASSASGASSSATLAQDWAIKTDGPVSGGEFSAKYWAGVANTSNSVSADTVDAKGDLIAGAADNVVVRVPVGSDDQVLMADSSTSSGLKWGTVDVSGEIATHNSQTTGVHGIADTSLLETTAGAQAKADAAQLAAEGTAASALSGHELATRNVHGIADTAELETQIGAQAKANAAQVSAISYADESFIRIPTNDPTLLGNQPFIDDSFIIGVDQPSGSPGEIIYYVNDDIRKHILDTYMDAQYAILPVFRFPDTENKMGLNDQSHSDIHGYIQRRDREPSHYIDQNDILNVLVTIHSELGPALVAVTVPTLEAIIDEETGELILDSDGNPIEIATVFTFEVGQDRDTGLFTSFEVRRTTYSLSDVNVRKLRLPAGQPGQVLQPTMDFPGLKWAAPSLPVTLGFALSDETTTLTLDNPGELVFHMPFDMKLTQMAASLNQSFEDNYAEFNLYAEITDPVTNQHETYFRTIYINSFENFVDDFVNELIIPKGSFVRLDYLPWTYSGEGGSGAKVWLTGERL